MPITPDYPAIAFDALHVAWLSVIADYDERRLNSERALQASLYHYLRKGLEDRDFYIFVEPYLKIGGAYSCYIDLLVTHKENVVLAVELKYKPSSKPSASSVSADLTKLIQLKHRRTASDRTNVVIRRFLSAKDEKVNLKIAPRSFAVFASFVKQKGFFTDQREFWRKHRDGTVAPNGAPPRSMPNRLVALFAATGLGQTAQFIAWAKPKAIARVPDTLRKSVA